MSAIHINLRTAAAPLPGEPPAITAHEVATALFEASERIVMAPSHERQGQAIEANTALWLALGSAARDGLLDLPKGQCQRLCRIAETVARRTLGLRPAEGGGALPMRLVRLNDIACRAIAPPTRLRRPIVRPPFGAH